MEHFLKIGPESGPHGPKRSISEQEQSVHALFHVPIRTAEHISTKRMERNKWQFQQSVIPSRLTASKRIQSSSVSGT